MDMKQKKFFSDGIFRKGLAIFSSLAILLSCASCSFSKKTNSDETKEQTKETKDPRVPDYHAPDDPIYETKTYKWHSDSYGDQFAVNIDIDVEMYQHYCEVKRTFTIFGGHMAVYINDENNKALMEDIANQIREQCNEYGYDEDQAIIEAINFVQSIPYELDIDSKGEEEYSKYPIETLYEENGDCEDTSMLLAGILKAMVYDVVFFWYLSGHMAVGVKVDGMDEGRYFEYEGERYYYIETTATGWEMGEEPDDHDVVYVISADPE